MSTPGSSTAIRTPPTQSFPRKRESRIIPTLPTGRASLDSSFQSTPTSTWSEKGGCDSILPISYHCSIIVGVKIFLPVAQAPCTQAIRNFATGFTLDTRLRYRIVMCCGKTQTRNIVPAPIFLGREPLPLQNQGFIMAQGGGKRRVPAFCKSGDSNLKNRRGDYLKTTSLRDWLKSPAVSL